MRSSRPLCAIGMAVLVFAAPLLLVTCATTPVPTDPVKTGCSVPDAATFNSWFATGGVTLNGVVNPADSTAFLDTPINCNFYLWSEQMFLWVTSPSPDTYGGGGRIFNSPVFYDVSPLDANMDRTFIAHSGAYDLRALSMRAAQVGKHGLPVIVDKRGALLEIERPQFGPTGKQLILDQEGRAVEIGRTALTEKKQPVFFDTAGNVIQGARPLIRNEFTDRDKELIVQKFTIGNVAFYLGFLGNVVEVEQGQADGSVLMAQNRSLVYYAAMVNDVYAYFLTGAKNGAISGTQFPTTAAELTNIENYAIANGRPSPDPFPDGEALAIELKTAWVEAAGLANLDTYITMRATIPTYDAFPTTWVQNGHKTVLMALVGMHVVGSAGSHPEMIWATFEHKNNAPNAPYTYASTTGTKTVDPDFSRAYLFCAANPSLNSLNLSHMWLDSTSPDTIRATFPYWISPSNTIRGNAWGAAIGVSPNPGDATDSDSNSELISMNNDVRGMLDPGDVRNNYIMTGSTWTIQGAGFTGNFGNPGNPGAFAGRAAGTSQLANTTMETYQQGPYQAGVATFNSAGNNCFNCHGDGTNTTTVSHLYFTPGYPGHGLLPLF